ncbi:putative integral membrane protein [Aspergillus steynii IBT 23096]|uniref:Putative integral membrane protein n=1 Tax=Aspergillus steynii IBT 23096 TaxID=1392250 RepID=A0A2I2G0Q5_9EURO|nr:putative integral membrane protein [Aspergillus steynii IBT 23096]PLB46462.1 putative integral membrane protein [Aspergillus steynii IBT 23096]
MTSADDDRSLEVKAVAAVFMSVACVTVMLRCYVRGWVVKGFGWDDGTMVFAMLQLFHVMFSACMIGGSIYGTGRRFADLTAHERVTAMKYWWLCEIAYCFASIFCKISVCIFLMRITVKPIHLWILYTVMVLTVLAGLVFMFLMLLQCKPLAYFWTRTAFDPDIDGHCISIDIIIAMTYVYSAFAAICDFTVGLLPIFLVRKLHMKKQTKIAVVCILSMACIASSAVIIRIPYVKTFADPDFLYATVEIAIWSNIETGLGITAGSLATLRPLLRHWLGSRADPSYSSPFPGPSASRRAAAGASRDRPFPLGSLDNDVQSRLRPDKLAVTVTTIQSQSQHDPEQSWRGGPSSPNSSEERLTIAQPSPIAVHDGGGEMGLSIHQTFEVTQTSTGGLPGGGSGEERVGVREHV